MKGSPAVITLGSKIRDTITGLEGIATMRAEYLYGCVRIALQPTGVNGEGKPYEELFLDEQRVEILKVQPPQVSADSTPGIPGGPQTNPRRASDSRR